MIYLDTHVVVWLYAGMLEKLSPNALEMIEGNPIAISPIVKLELTYLYETKRITTTSQSIINDLHKQIGLKICDAPYEAVINKAIKLTWARDPFDRLIVAHALCNEAALLTKDKTILKHCKIASWL